MLPTSSPLPSRKLSAAVALTLLFAAAPARAEFPNPGLYLGVFGGANLTLRDWDLGNSSRQASTVATPFPPTYKQDIPSLLASHSPLFGLRLGWQMISHAALEAEFAYLPVQSTAGGHNDIIFWDINLLINILRSNWTPIVEGGVGSYHILGGDLQGPSDPSLSSRSQSLRFHLGLGVRGLLTRWLALRIEARDVLATQSFDKGGSNNLEIMAGLDFFLVRGSGSADKDGDGVPDSADKCPDAAGPEDNQGCPTTDRDKDGVSDGLDQCPDVPAGAIPDPRRPGCPADGDGDGVPDTADKCLGAAAGKYPDPTRPGCPADRDGDGVPDENDLCPDVPAGAKGDPARPGCPADADHDGVPDDLDQCPEVASGKYPDATRLGCPADRDGDGVIDEKDACIDVAAGKAPDPKRPGCPADADGDSIPDAVDACPDKPGAPDPDPKKNGCPGLVKIENGQIIIVEQVYFATGKEVILPRSFPVLQAVVHAVKALPPGRTVLIEGHTDDRGDAKKNVELSKHRAEAVKKWLVAKGLSAAQLDAEGFGPARPIAPNSTEAGRSKNRRVEFHIKGVESKP